MLSREQAIDLKRFALAYCYALAAVAFVLSLQATVAMFGGLGIFVVSWAYIFAYAFVVYGLLMAPMTPLMALAVGSDVKSKAAVTVLVLPYVTFVEEAFNTSGEHADNLWQLALGNLGFLTVTILFFIFVSAQPGSDEGRRRTPNS